MFAYRLISGDSFLRTRSFCPSCNQTIAWYDLIPILSWFFLKGRCRNCLAPISWLYCFIELISLLFFYLLSITVAQHYLMGYFIFFSALIITIRTDFEHMLISRYVSLFLVPVGYFLSYFNFLPIPYFYTILGSCTAYLFLYGINKIFLSITHKNGIGQGDIELLACIGSFLGITGWWISLIIGSCLGSLVGITYLIVSKQSSSAKIPFGPFLAFGAFFYVLFNDSLLFLVGG